MRSVTVISMLFGFMAVLPSQVIAAKYTYMIDHGTPGVIASESKMARLVLKAGGDCRAVTYEVIADGVKSLQGSLDLSKPLSMPLDFTTITLSCSVDGIQAIVDN